MGIVITKTSAYGKQQQEQQGIVKRKRKCRRNRTWQQFKLKYRAHVSNEKEIARLFDNNNHTISEQSQNDQAVDEQTKESNKRKSDLS